MRPARLRAITLSIAILFLLPSFSFAAPKKSAVKQEKRGLTVVRKQSSDSRQRIALVIGNSNYASSPLRNPVNDARSMATTLRRLGFEVEEKTDLGYIAMNDAVESFGNRLRSGGVGLFYYAGHGMQVGGNNYLIPIDARINAESEVRYKAVDAGLVLAKMDQAKSDVNLLVLDACRDNPFGRSFRSSSRGLANMDAPTGTLIAYATAPGKTAADGSGKNGAYTEALIETLQTPGLKVEEVFKQVRKLVLSRTANAQVPWESSSLTGDFHFMAQTETESIPAVSTSDSGKRPSPAAKTASADSASLSSPRFLEELDDYLKQADAPLTEIKRLADAGDLLGKARYCAVSTHERYNLGLQPSEGIALCRELAEQGVPVGMYLYGRAYGEGRGVSKNEAEAVRWYRKGAEKGQVVAQNNLGLMYEAGRGVAENEAEAARWYRKAAEQGFYYAQYRLGVMYSSGRGVAKDEAKAVSWYRRAAEQGNADGQMALGHMYANGQGVAKDEAEAVRWYRKVAEQGYAGGQYALGYMYANGQGVAKDEAEAVRLYRKAAEQGAALAQNNLGVMYQNGQGVTKDDAEAVRWYRKAAEQGYAYAQSNLGVMYANGRGVTKDETEAVRWYRKAAEQGNTDGQYALGYMYDIGQGIAKDDAEAVRWYRKAAEQGNANAINELKRRGLM